jgi:hypothetical protein
MLGILFPTSEKRQICSMSASIWGDEGGNIHNCWTDTPSAQYMIGHFDGVGSNDDIGWYLAGNGAE